MGNSPGSQPLPTAAELCAVVWWHLEKHPDSRPLQEDIARILGMSPRRLRRAWQETGRSSVRELITYGCLSYALWLIHADHCKAVAAVQLAGFRSYWNANRQCRRYAGCTLGRTRERFPFKLDIHQLQAKLAELRARDPPGRNGHDKRS